MRSSILCGVFLCAALGALAPQAACAAQGPPDPGLEEKLRFRTMRTYAYGSYMEPSPVDFYPGKLLPGDFGGDGVDDVAVSGEVLVETGRWADGLFTVLGDASRDLRSAPTPWFPIEGFYGWYLVGGDFDGDRDLDLVQLGLYDQDVPEPHEFRVLKNDGFGHFSVSGHFEAGLHPAYGTAADFDGDGDLDLAISRTHHNLFITDLSVVWNLGDGTFGQPTIVPAVWDQREIAAGDLDRDGLPDIVVGGQKGHPPAWFWYGGLLAVIRNLGGWRFAEPKIYEVSHPDRVWTVQIADLDADGFLDFVAGSANFPITTLFFFGPGGEVVAREELQTMPSTGHRLGDLDGDKLPEIVSDYGGSIGISAAGALRIPCTTRGEAS